MNKSSIDFDQLAKHFELYNRTEGKSPHTVGWYNQASRQFRLFLTESKTPATLDALP